jgi:hypothetical protein
MRKIRLNFIPFAQQDFSVAVYRREVISEDVTEQDGLFYMLPKTEPEDDDYEHEEAKARYEVINHEAPGFEKFKVPKRRSLDVVGRRMFDRIAEASSSIPSFFIHRPDSLRNKRLHYMLERHPKGRKCVWIEPYYLKSERLWGILLGYHFVVDEDEHGTAHKLDKEIQIATGSLNSRGLSNTDFYLFKHGYLETFIRDVLPQINSGLNIKFHNELTEVPSYKLNPKEYVLGAGAVASSPFYGLSKHGPLATIEGEYAYEFLYHPEDRQFAVTLLKGLRGETYPTIFSGMEKFFKLPFTNDRITGKQLASFSTAEIDAKIMELKTLGKPVLPVIITSSTDEHTYFMLKSKFTNAGIPCQVVTKDLVGNQYAMRYSLGNIGLQMFAKLGGKPWKMKPAGNDYLIIGIGQSYNVEHNAEGTTVEKNISYSILTDSSGIFNDLQVLSEGVESDSSYWEQLIANLVGIINKSGKKHIALHVPFRISKKKVLEKVTAQIDHEIELTVLVINDKNEYFGFNYANNGLVPFESTFIKLSKYDYLIWFEGLHPSNPKLTKRFGNPLMVNFWYSNQHGLLDDHVHRESLLQDCINLSGANWRGFKAKQLPISIYYCQEIAKFIAKFRDYHLEHIDISNLKPWFL